MWIVSHNAEPRAARVESDGLVGDVAHREQLCFVGRYIQLGLCGRQLSRPKRWLCTSPAEMAVLMMSGTVDFGHEARETLRPRVPDLDPRGQVLDRGKHLVHVVGGRRDACRGDGEHGPSRSFGCLKWTGAVPCAAVPRTLVWPQPISSLRWSMITWLSALMHMLCLRFLGG